MKDQFGWPEDTEEIANAGVGASTTAGSSALSNVEDMSNSAISQPVAGPLDK